MEARIIEDSINSKGCRLTTFQLKYHRYIHGELMTHRVFSRNASSSRAIPVMTMLKQVWNDPAIPVQWGANKSGMQSSTLLSPFKSFIAKFIWKFAGKVACVFAYSLMKVGLHKQWGNRLLEPWQFIHVIVSATEYENFWQLRCHKDAQPEIQMLANKMKVCYDESIPKQLKFGEWHLPYITSQEKSIFSKENCKKMSTARCCRVSYLKHNGESPSYEDDIKLYNRLVGSVPVHASPAEHPACNMENETFHANLKGWYQHRREIETFNLKER